MTFKIKKTKYKFNCRVLQLKPPGAGVIGWTGAVTLARLRLQLRLKDLFNNSRKLHGT